ncbi:MAG TPA: tetratricopeptide repeat protein [Xanthomonadales bacterium]|nr:tetratricopeptide repeat protein [Xanthomonadales bacterium]
MGNWVSNFWQELKRRKVVRVAIGYALVAWVLVEISSVLFPALLLPDWSTRLVVALALIGFPIALVMAWALETSPEGLRRELSPSEPETAVPGSGRPVKRVESAAGQQLETMDERRAILVLPFANMSESSENEYFSDGITEEILNLLARQPELRVVSRTTSFSFKGSTMDVRAIADRLGVQIVLEGSIRRAGNRVRIIAQLIDASNDAHLWSDSFDREIDDIFAVQAEIAHCIVNCLDLEPASFEEGEASTPSIEAYEYYLRGRQYFHTLSENGLRFACQMFNKAIEIDPGFARAYAGSADSHSLISQWFDRSPEHLEAADRASNKALELAPNLAESHSARGFSLSLKGDLEAASREFERALELDPQNYEALYLYGRSRYVEGRNREAADLWTRAHATQPDEFQSIALNSQVLRKLDPGEAAAATGQAIAAIERRLELNPDDLRALGLGAALLISAGRVEAGLGMVERALELAPTDMAVLYNAACSYAQAGRNDQALEVLERRMQRAGTIYREWVEQDSDFDGLQGDPRFTALLERMPRVEG